MQDAVARHLAFESASFHTPGHKGRSSDSQQESYLRRDVTELPGLDDLSDPAGPLAELERRAARLWGSGDCVISTNGASAGLTAAMLSLSSRGSTVLVPRNAHRSIINGLVLSGLFPIWYEPKWEDEWCTWASVSETSAQRLLDRLGDELAGFVLVSPTYGGALSDVSSIARKCRDKGIPLVVDEAHGAHFLPGSTMPASAISSGADVVVHSLHKTVTALTQTGMVHVSSDSLLPAKTLRVNLGLLQSSSPSYLLMQSIEQAIAFLEQEGNESLSRLGSLSTSICQSLPEGFELYQPSGGSDPAHIFVKHRNADPEELCDYLADVGIFTEAVIGNGVLLLLGLGSSIADAELLSAALRDFASGRQNSPTNTDCITGTPKRLPEPVQVLSPRQAFMLPAEVLPVHQCAGRIAAETVAPCPPGTALVVAGQRVPQEILETASIQKLRVVVE